MAEVRIHSSRICLEGWTCFGDPKGLVHYVREKANKLQALEAAINKYNEKHQ